MAPTWNSSAFFCFFFLHRKTCSSLVTSARLNVITTALSTTFPALSRVTYTPCLFSSFCLTFLLGMIVPEPNEFRQLDTFPHLRNCTPKLPRSTHPAPPLLFMGSSPLVVLVQSTAAYTFRFAFRTVFAVFCVCCFVLARIPCFFACQFSRNYPRQFFRGGHSYIVDSPFLHYDFPFPTRYCIPYVRSGLYHLSFASRDFLWAPNNLDYALHSVFSIGVDTTLSESWVVYR